MELKHKGKERDRDAERERQAETKRQRQRQDERLLATTKGILTQPSIKSVLLKLSRIRNGEG